MKRPTYKKGENYDKQYLTACLAMAGYGSTAKDLKKILTTYSEQTIKKKFDRGDFTRDDILRFRFACNMDIYDIMRCFFTSLLGEEDGQKYAVRQMLINVLTDSFYDE